MGPVIVVKRQGLVTVTAILHSILHDVGLAVTHATAFRSYVPTSLIKVGAALIVWVPLVDVKEVTA